MKNIHLLPTDKPSRLSDCVNYKHLYITSDEEIKEGDWYLTFLSNEVIGQPRKCEDTNWDFSYCKKIILTTDPELIKDGVQAIDDEFLEWFVKNPSCNEVKVDWLGTHTSGVVGYKIIIPQEEPKTNLEKLPFPELVEELANYYKEVPLVEEPKQEIDMSKYILGIDPYDTQETLEEAAKRTYQKGLQDDIDLSFYDGVKLGAKWQAERMYSEENMVKFAEWIADSKLHGYSKQLYEAMIIHKVSTTKELLQIWNKQFNEQKNGK